MNSKVLNLILVFALGAMVFFWIQKNQEYKQVKSALEIAEEDYQDHIKDLEESFDAAQDSIKARDEKIASFQEEREDFQKPVETAKNRENENKDAIINSFNADSLALYFSKRRKAREAGQLKISL